MDLPGEVEREGARRPPGTPDMPVSALNDLRREVEQYRPVDVLIRCRAFALAWSADRSQPLRIELPRQLDRFGRDRTLAIAPWALALISRLSLIGGSELAPGTLDDRGFLRILRISTELYDDELDARSLLLRTAEEQIWYQRSLRKALGRALWMYSLVPRQTTVPSFDFTAEFVSEFGLDPENFVAIAFLLYSILSATLETPYQFLMTMDTSQLNSRARAVLSPDNLRLFLDAASADPERYREAAAAHSPLSRGLGRYDLDPLLDFPIIELPGHGNIAPIPDALVWFAEHGPYWRLRAASRGADAVQPFGTFFGKHIFEPYVGELLADRFGADALLSEDDTQYQDGAGPDWIVRLGDTALAIEVTVGTVRRGIEVDQLERFLDDRIGRRINALPEKIRKLSEARPELGLSDVRQWHRIVVTKEPLPWIPWIRGEFLDPKLAPGAAPYHLMDIEELEDLLAYEPNYGVAKLLADFESNPDPEQDIRSRLSEFFKTTGNRLVPGRLVELQDEFFDSLTRRDA